MENKLLLLLNSINQKNIQQFIAMLNKSKFVKEIYPNEKFFIHSGLKFKIHTNEILEIYYDCINENLIVQPPTNTTLAEPKLGDIFVGSSQYINNPTNLVVEILGINQFYLKLFDTVQDVDISSEMDKYLILRTFDDEGYSDISLERFSKLLNYTIYLGNGHYEIYNPFLDSNRYDSDEF